MVFEYISVVTFILSPQFSYHVIAEYNDASSEVESAATSSYDYQQNIDNNVMKNPNVSLKGQDAAPEHESKNDCWFKFNTTEHFNVMDNLDAKYAGDKTAYQNKVGNAMDEKMLDDLLHGKGKGHRAIYEAGGDPNKIPAGLNLMGYCMMRLKDSILFFHRMKLRNNTHFQVKYLHNDIDTMSLIVRLGLNDLHLAGAYERSATYEDPSILYYRPTLGQLELLLKNVDYKMEGRLRLVSDRFIIELINSELIIADDILMMYRNTEKSGEKICLKLQKANIDDYWQRLKTDLDMWLKDYFNDYLLYFPLPKGTHKNVQEYDKQKTIALNDFVSYALTAIRDRIITLGGSALKLPNFTIFSVPNMQLKITNGIIYGMPTMYRKSVGTGRKVGNMRVVDVIIGFSKLRVEYDFEVVLGNGSPPLTGQLMLIQDGTTAQLGLSLVKNPETVDLNFEYIQQVKPESLIIKGPASRFIANYKHQVENQILAIMSNTLLHNIKMLNTITKCVPNIYTYSADPKMTLHNCKFAFCIGK